MVTQKLKGLWIPIEVLLNKDLSDKEKIILSMILYLSEESKSCFANVQNASHSHELRKLNLVFCEKLRYSCK